MTKATAPARADYELKLYVAGQTPKSRTAIHNLKRLCETHLAGRYTIEVVRHLPEPIKKIIGDLSSEERVLVGLDVQPIERVNDDK